MKSQCQIFIFLFVLPILGFTQTEIIEKENFQKKYVVEEKYSPEKLKEIGRKWKELMTDYGGYPNLSYDSSLNEINYKFINSFKGINKEIIYNRIIEWSAIVFGNSDHVIRYKNMETGKIILKGAFDIMFDYDYKNFWGVEKENTTSKTCYFTYIFTIKDDKIKSEIQDIRYEYTISILNSGGFYSETEYIKPISQLYPITNYKVEKWKEYLDILFETNNSIRSLQDDVAQYIENYNSDYNF